MVEALLLMVFGAILFVEYGGGWKDSFFETIKKNPTGLLKYFGAGAVLASALGVTPYVYMSIYMRNHGFHAYELFSDGALHIISVNVFINCAVVAFLMTFSVLLWGKGERLLNAVLVVFNISLITAMVAAMLASGNPLSAISTVAFALIIGVYVVYLRSTDFDQKARWWWVPSLPAFLIIFVPSISQEMTAGFVGNGLRILNLGSIDVAVKREKEPEKVWRLLLRTNEHLYLIEKSELRNDRSTEKAVVHILPAEGSEVSYKPQ